MRTHVPVLVDGAQAAPHLRLDVQELDCDFYAFSGHKVYGPTGIGVLYGKAALLEAMPPYQGGGNMIRSVTFEHTTFATTVRSVSKPARRTLPAPSGWPPRSRTCSEVGLEAIAAHEQALLAYATRQLAALPRLQLIGTAPHKLGILSFVLEGIHPHDVATVLDREGIAVRAGHHCAQPLMQRLGIPATTRASLALYTTRDEIDALITGLERAVELLA